jgi:hypothetical protein
MSESGSTAAPLLTAALDGGEGSVSRLGRITREEKAPDTHCIGDWASPRTDLNAVCNVQLEIKSKIFRQYCTIFGQSKKCGARGTAVASERFWNNIRF